MLTNDELQAKLLEALEQSMELKKQRDELLTALRKFIDSHEECTDFDGFTAQIVNMDDYHEAQEVADSVKGKPTDNFITYDEETSVKIWSDPMNGDAA